MTPAELSRTVLRSVRGAVAERELSVAVPARIVVRPAPRPGCGEYASNVALQLAGQAGLPAREVAEILRRRLAGSAGIARVEIAGPGFLNFHLGAGATAGLVADVLARGARYGEPEAGAEGPGRPAGPARYAGEWARARERVAGEVMARLGRGGDAVDAVEDDGGLAGLVVKLGADEARWVLLKPAAADPVRVPERPVQHEDNPRFRVQYAYARTRAMVRNAGELGFTGEPGEVVATGGEPGRGVTVTGEPGQVVASAGDEGAQPVPPVLQALETCLATYPTAVAAAGRRWAPDRVVRHLEATADAYLRWQEEFPPLPAGECKPLAVHRARVALAEATGTVLGNGLHLLGISAPDHV
ncbi:DALR anticodon-binding domain-containing protein [Streptomyces sp. RS10V-4]|uniref:ArgS-related anticodon-binding protein NrtL n=1 Tax=Streptomyces rhizoryzae TaxID=2932493 RepID=UPI002003C10D|nr:DALR anticodon-binding domain-containing protein [Streptomyces rhizoryzae]MCK7625780.1 DALR anticodon-binding domain-containing protein [Streptomyces rhizoryzae]